MCAVGWLHRDCVHQNHIIRARSLQCDPKYLDIYWNSPLGQQRVMEVAASTSGLYTLSVSKVTVIPVPIPPLSEQAVIVEAVEDAMSLVEAADTAARNSNIRASRLRQSILKNAFEGKLVEQNPTDEPASVLLDRIRAERERRPAHSRAKRGGAGRRGVEKAKRGG